MSQEARQHGQLAHELHAAGRWSEAIDHAQACLRLAPAGSALSVWAMHQLACVYADAGQPERAVQFAHAYLHQVDLHPSLEAFTPFVLHAVASASYQRRRWLDAFRWYNKALLGYVRTGDSARAALTSQNLAWSLIRVGRIQAARSFLAPRAEFPADLTYLHDGAMSAILAAEGRHQEAITWGRQALLAATRRSVDVADAAEVALVVARSLRELGDLEDASATIHAAAEFCALQQWDTVVRLLLSERAEGGDSLYEPAASSRGSADLRHRGCFCTGLG